MISSGSDLCKVSMVQTGRWGSRRRAHRPAAAAPTSGSPLSQLHSHTARPKPSDSQSPETILHPNNYTGIVLTPETPLSSDVLYFKKHYNDCMIKRCRIQCQCIVCYPVCQKSMKNLVLEQSPAEVSLLCCTCQCAMKRSVNFTCELWAGRGVLPRRHLNEISQLLERRGRR